MKKNLGTVDRITRIVLAVVLGGLYLGGQITGTLGVLFALVAVVLLLTGAVSFCPLYFALKLSTKKEAA
jgi:amino acid transporter